MWHNDEYDPTQHERIMHALWLKPGILDLDFLVFLLRCTHSIVENELSSFLYEWTNIQIF